MLYRKGSIEDLPRKTKEHWTRITNLRINSRRNYMPVKAVNNIAEMASAQNSNSPQSSIPTSVIRSPLLAAINETHKAVELVLNNRFEDAQKLLETQRRTSIYHALGYATILYLRAGMTFEPQAFNEALEAIGEALKVVNSRRRGWSFFRSSTSHATIDSFTNEQLHAELCHAELLLEQSMITMMLNESSIFRMFGALIGVNDAFSTYRYCYTILEKRTWKRAHGEPAKLATGQPEASQAEASVKTGTKVESDAAAKNKQDAEEDEELKQHFESGVRLGLGAFNVLLSSLPDVAMRMLALVGISGRRQFGFEQMRLASEMRNGETIRGILASIALLAFHLVVAYSFGTADGDLDWCERTLDRALTHFERCAIFLYFSGRLQLVRGRVVDASKILQRAIDAQTEWRELHYACRWEMMWCAAFSARWLEAYRHADSLLRSCSWSKCLFAYCSAAFLLQHRAALSSGAQSQPGTEEEAEADAYADEKAQVLKMAGDEGAVDKRIEELLALVPKSMQRLAGKHLPLEKLAQRRAQQFSMHKRLTLPAFELIYVFCGVPMLANNEELLAPFIAVVDAELRLRKLPLATDTLEQALGQCAQNHTDHCSTDEACFLYLLKAACLSNRPADDTATSQARLLADRQAACTFLDAIVNQEKEAKAQAIEYETYLYPCAKVELALIKLKSLESTQDTAAHETQLAEAIRLLESAEKDHPKYFLRSRVHVRIRSLLNNVAPRLEQLRARRTSEQLKARRSSASSNGNVAPPSSEHHDEQKPSANRLKASASETGFNRIG